MDKFSELKAAAQANAQPVAWSGWACQNPGKMPRLYGDKAIAEINCDYNNGDQLLFLSSTLLAELEASKKSNSFLKEQLAKLANFNPDWDMLEACRESWREVAAALKEAEAKLEAKDKRIAELEQDELAMRASSRAVHEAQENHINQQQDIIESLEKKNVDLGRVLGAAEKRLATPVRLMGEMIVHDWEHRIERQEAFQHRKKAWDARLEEDKKAIRAAGFTFTVEGDE
ncbi:TPA: hypothetical protein SLG95_000783 [Serratia liquefaciens]|nr:hypothetical protein [Serratia liquefaciens]